MMQMNVAMGGALRCQKHKDGVWNTMMMLQWWQCAFRHQGGEGDNECCEGDDDFYALYF